MTPLLAKALSNTLAEIQSSFTHPPGPSPAPPAAAQPAPLAGSTARRAPPPLHRRCHHRPRLQRWPRQAGRGGGRQRGWPLSAASRAASMEAHQGTLSEQRFGWRRCRREPVQGRRRCLPAPLGLPQPPLPGASVARAAAAGTGSSRLHDEAENRTSFHTSGHCQSAGRSCAGMGAADPWLPPSAQQRPLLTPGPARPPLPSPTYRARA